MSAPSHASVLLLATFIAAMPAHALVGGAAADKDGNGRSVVTIVGSRGNFCSGALIAADVVLTAAHCVPQGATYKIVIPGESPPRLIDVKRVAAHPQFNAKGIDAHRASADVALLQTSEPLTRSRAIAPTATPLTPIAAGNRYSVSGIGVTVRGDGKSGGTVRSASLVSTSKPGTLQIRLVDPATDNKSAGLGACTGDSGGPVFENQNGRAVIVGVVSWSTAPNNAAGCGGLTGTTPLSLYRGWMLETMKAWSGALSPRDAGAPGQNPAKPESPLHPAFIRKSRQFACGRRGNRLGHRTFDVHNHTEGRPCEKS